MQVPAPSRKSRSRSVFRDWANLARETVRSLERQQVAELYTRDWVGVRAQLTSEHRAQIEGEPGRLKRLLRTAHAIVFGLARRLAPARRLVFAVTLVLFLLALLFPAGENLLFLAFLLLLFLFAMELVDKIRFGDELALARELQASLVTSVLPDHAEFELGAFNRTANMVGGDVYEFVELPDGRLAVLFGDASGHGMTAGLIMAVAHAGFRTQLETDPSPAAMVATLNRILCRAGGPRSFFSCVYLLLSPGGQFSVTVSGHPSPLEVDVAGAVRRRYGKGSYPLGIRSGLEWVTEESSLSPGFTLFLYSDGLYEACGAAGEPFGEERIEQALRVYAGSAPGQLIRALAEEVTQFCGRRTPEDDISIAAIRRKTGAS